MINPKELRQGNLVEARGKFGSYPAGVIAVEEVLSDGVNLSQGDMTIYRQEDIFPIPLNDQWLQRSGFKAMPIGKYQDDGNWHLQLPADGAVMAYDDRWLGAELGHFHYNGCTIWHSPRHVHELQNLYFALTGEELDIQE